MNKTENNESTGATEFNKWPFRAEENSPTYSNGTRESNSSKNYPDGVTIEKSRDGKTTYEIWHQNGLRHRDNAPAYIAKNEAGEVTFQSWYQHGKKHRDNNLPAVEDFSQEEVWQEYYQHGKYHRVGGPATSIGKNQYWYLEGEMVKMITDDGDTYYIENGVHHNELGPAAIRANGDKHWFIHGKKHRLDGPASEWADGTKQWFIDGLCHREDGPAIEHHDGTKEWWLNGKCHRENDLPAVEDSNGQKEWWVNGEIHRESGPAVICANGQKQWWKNGKIHREDGPAIERPDGTKQWRLHGKILSEEKFNKAMQARQDKQRKQVAKEINSLREKSTSMQSKAPYIKTNKTTI